ncbi:MAG: DNA-processing protein DprA [Candidatus Sulfotelmatobacter sp.]
MSNTLAVPSTHVLEWLSLSLTSGLGPTKARKLVEHFGSAEAVFHASLTELEGTGIKAVSAQSIAIGKSSELAREEIARAAGAGVTIVSGEDASYPARLKEIYDPPLVLYIRGDPAVLAHPGIAMVGTRHPTPYGREWPSGWPAISRHKGWLLSAAWHVEWTRLAIVERSLRKGKQSRYSARAWM